MVDEDEGIALRLVGALVTLVLLGAVGFGAWQVLHKPAAPKATMPAPSPLAAAPIGDGASVVVVDGLVKFYFASGSAVLADGADAALAAVVSATQTGQTAVISGFHDDTGGAALNAELAKQRAMGVRDALTRLGAPADKIELKKPEQTMGTGANAEARRVEVAVR